MTTGILFAMLCALSLADCWTTYIALKSGKGRELNKVLAWLMDKIGMVPALVLIKGIFLTVVYLYCMNFIALGIVIAMYVAVVGNNLIILRKISKSL